MNKVDITQFSDSELSLIVMNDESWYRMRKTILRENKQGSNDLIDSTFTYNPEQLDELINDINEDLNEES